jgi:GT2 family glycosyltransferase
VADAAAVIVTYNSEDVLAGCLAALREHAPEFHAVVVDNASSDSTVAIAEQHGAEVIANHENRGFAAAANQGFRASRANFVLLLNPDAHLGSSISPLVGACEKAGIAGGRLRDGRGDAQAGFTVRRFPTATVLALELLGINRLWPSNPWNRRYRYLGRDLTQPGPAEQPAGAFLMIRRDVWLKLGGFDEEFWPIWFEDVDFCRRAATAGLETQYEPAASAYHLGGHSIKKIDTSSRQLYWYDSLLRYAGKHFGYGRYCLLCVAGACGALPRMIVGMFQERSLRPVANCLRILHFVGRRLVSRPPSGLAQRPGSEY